MVNYLNVQRMLLKEEFDQYRHSNSCCNGYRKENCFWQRLAFAVFFEPVKYSGCLQGNHKHHDINQSLAEH